MKDLFNKLKKNKMLLEKQNKISIMDAVMLDLTCNVNLQK